MIIEFDVQITTGKMYDYMLRHILTSFAGIVGEVIGLLLVSGYFVVEDPTKKWIYLGAGIICVLYQPVALYLRAKRQVSSNEVFKEPLHYKLDDMGITVRSGENEDSIEWTGMYRAVSTSRSIILYTNRVNACIFPKVDLGDKKDEVIKMISTHMDPKQVNIRG